MNALRSSRADKSLLTLRSRWARCAGWPSSTRQALHTLIALGASSTNGAGRSRCAGCADSTRFALRSRGTGWTRRADLALRTRWTRGSCCADIALRASCTYRSRWTRSADRSSRTHWADWSLRSLSSCRGHNDALAVVLHRDVGALWVSHHLDLSGVNLDDIGAVIADDGAHYRVTSGVTDSVPSISRVTSPLLLTNSMS